MMKLPIVMTSDASSNLSGDPPGDSTAAAFRSLSERIEATAALKAAEEGEWLTSS